MLSDLNKETAFPPHKQLSKFIHAFSGIRSLGNIEEKECLEHELYNAIVKSVLTYVDMECCSIFLLEDEQLKCVSGISWDDRTNSNIVRLNTASHRFAINEGVMGRCASSRMTVHIPDCSEEPAYVCFGTEKNSQAKGSLICAPLISNDEVLGVLNVSHPYANFFDPWHEKVVASYANIIAKLIHNHRLIHSMESEIYSRTRELQTALRESEELKKRYQQLSFIDYLTELHNRRYFFPEFNSNISNSIRHKQSLSLLVLDLDLFKSVNDNYGHELGDAVLIGVSQLLKRQIRKGDLLARLGGEEFVIALVNTDIEGAAQFAERLRIMIHELKWSYQNQDIHISTSIGISAIDDVSELTEDVDEISRLMMANADEALYYCKQNGRNQIKIYADLHQQKNSNSS